ncbi:MAG: hypothetical protein KAH30_04850 [Caldisericia bacterium]|nr:hypothetical protein [Caldisericia bacterium]
MRWLLVLVCVVVVLSVVSFVDSHDPETFIETIEPEKIELFNRFERLGLLPPSFELDHMDEYVSRNDCISLVSLVADWGDRLWIQRTSSGLSKTFLKIKRFLGYVDTDIEFLENISSRENATLLMMARRWNLRVNAESLDVEVFGWEMLEMEYGALSRMLQMAGIPRTLIDEVGSVLEELNGIQGESNSLFISGKLSGIVGLNSYRGDEYLWAYYLTALQHELLPESSEEIHFNERSTPYEVLNLELTMYETLLFADRMTGYVDSFTGHVSGFYERVNLMKDSVVVTSRQIVELSNSY